MINWLMGFLVVCLVAGFAMWLSDPIKGLKENYQTLTPHCGTVKNKILVGGSIQPRNQVAIKAHISGILDQILVSIGDSVRKGQAIARIRILPNLVSLEQAETRLRIAKINLEKEKRVLKRGIDLFANGVISAAEFESINNSFLVALEDSATSEKQRQIILQGRRNSKGDRSNIIQSTLAGIVLELPLQAGASVVQRNNYHEGTTVAVVADLTTLTFKGQIHENYIYKVYQGMPVPIRVPAWHAAQIHGVIAHIAPRATSINGVAKFPIQVNLDMAGLDQFSCGVTGVAEIILAEVSDVLVIDEKNLYYRRDSTFVELFHPKTGRFIEKSVNTGLSDGLMVQITGGLSLNSQVKVRE